MVFGLLQRPSTTAEAAAYRVPRDLRVYAVGDIHGCLAELDRLLGQIEGDCADTGKDVHLVFLGDLIDRGPDSKCVVERLLRGPLPGNRRSFIMGNHEEAMLEVWGGNLGSLAGWLTYGGVQTLESYGISRSEIFQLGTDLPRRMHEAIPESHINFIESFEDQVRIGDYLFVHAGIRPGVPLAEQDTFDLRWIRDEFLYDEEADHGLMVVHGHTISAEPEMRANRIGIDTGCFASGRLTALVLEGSERRFLST